MNRSLQHFAWLSALLAWAPALLLAQTIMQPAAQPVTQNPAQNAAQKAPADHQLISLDRPGDREFVRDLAKIINPADHQKIVKIADRLLTDKATPIIVVTIDSMADYGGSGMRIETFAHLLFDQWQIGVAKVNGQDWNTGILLLVSTGDRKARIELGNHWRHDNDVQCESIMEQIIVPDFKNGNFSGGILAGVEALDKMARGLALPQAAQSESAQSAHRSLGIPPWLIIVGIALAVFTVVSLIRRGSSGWGWLMWAGIFSAVGVLLYSIFNNWGSGGGFGGGGGFSGGSFGGGFSGGGGATGSW